MPDTSDTITNIVFKTKSIRRSHPGKPTIDTEQSEHVSLPDDERKAVDVVDLHQGGRYRAVAKLSMVFEHTHVKGAKYTSCSGTGQVTALDSLETSAHCLLYTCPECHGLFPAKYIKIYLGYNGRASMGNEDRADGVEFRCADSFTVLKDHYEKMKSKQATESTFDVASIRVAEAFKFVDPLRFEATPVFGKDEELGVVGYSGDMMYKSERGAQMFAHFKKGQSFDLSTSGNNMLMYTTSTFRGQSGSPVFRQTRPGVSIGVHQGSPAGVPINHACPIAGTYGVYVRSYKLVLSRAASKTFEYGKPITMTVEKVKAYSRDAFDRLPEKPELSVSEVLAHIRLAMAAIEKLQEELSTCTLTGPSEVELKDKIAGATMFLGLARLVAQQRALPEDFHWQPQLQHRVEIEDPVAPQTTLDTGQTNAVVGIPIRTQTPRNRGFRRARPKKEAISLKELRPQKRSSCGNQSPKKRRASSRK